MEKLVIIIPAFNEEKELKDVISDIPQNIDGIKKIEIDIISLNKGKDVSKRVLDNGLMTKVTYLEIPANKIKKILLALFYFVKIFFCKPIVCYKMIFKKYHKGFGELLNALLLVGPMVKKIDKYDIIHCNFGMTGNKYLKIARTLFIKKPLIVSFYGQDVQKYPRKKGKHVYDDLKKESNRIVAMTEDMKKELIKLGFDSSRIKVCRSGVDLEVYKYNFLSFKQNDILQIVSVGRLVKKRDLKIFCKQ